MKEVKAYQCEFCKRRVNMNKTHMAEHEYRCYYNPIRRACQTCRFKEEKIVEPNILPSFYCRAKNTFFAKIPLWERHGCNDWKEIKQGSDELHGRI